MLKSRLLSGLFLSAPLVTSASGASPSAGFAVDNSDRNRVVARWHSVYQASEGYQNRIQWTGNYTGSNGTVSSAFVADVERRLNYFRAMCGISSTVKVSTSSTVVIDDADPFKPSSSTKKAAACQNAALMMVRNYDPKTGANPALSHSPASSLTGWSPGAWNAAAKGNFAFGLYGPGAVTEYMVEQLSNSAVVSSWNSLVGHRRWVLYPPATVFASGDQPGESAYVPPSNVLYVLQNPEEAEEIPDPGFVAYPPAGYFPAPVNSPFWSVSRAGADFSGATVKMTDSSGKNVPLASIRRSDDYGDPAIIWEVPAAVASQTIYSDTKYSVLVTGIGGDEGIPATLSYSVTLINPDRLLSSHTITGPASVGAGKSGSFTFTRPAGAEGVRVVASRSLPATWTENGESSASKIIANVGSNYSLKVKPSTFAGFGVVSGKASYRLTFPDSYDLMKRTVPEQSFELDRDLLPKSGAKLTFRFRRGFMTKASVLVAEASTDGGVSWKRLGLPIKGASDTQFDTTVSTTSRPLPKSTTAVRVRFRYYCAGGSIYTHKAAPKSPTGIFIDDIKVTRCDWLEERKANDVAAGAAGFVFSGSTAGSAPKKGETWHLRMRTKLGGRWFPAGPSRTVKITAP